MQTSIWYEANIFYCSFILKYPTLGVGAMVQSEAPSYYFAIGLVSETYKENISRNKVQQNQSAKSLD